MATESELSALVEHTIIRPMAERAAVDKRLKKMADQVLMGWLLLAAVSEPAFSSCFQLLSFLHRLTALAVICHLNRRTISLKT